MFYLLDKNNNPYRCSKDEWADAIEDPKKRAVRNTYLKNWDINISTIFLGLDHNYSMVGDPILFETMVFGNGRLGQFDYYQIRYCTYDEAVRGHRETVRKVIDAIRIHQENK